METGPKLDIDFEQIADAGRCGTPAASGPAQELRIGPRLALRTAPIPAITSIAPRSINQIDTAANKISSRYARIFRHSGHAGRCRASAGAMPLLLVVAGDVPVALEGAADGWRSSIIIPTFNFRSRPTRSVLQRRDQQDTAVAFGAQLPLDL